MQSLEVHMNKQYCLFLEMNHFNYSLARCYPLMGAVWSMHTSWFIIHKINPKKSEKFNIEHARTRFWIEQKANSFVRTFKPKRVNLPTNRIAIILLRQWRSSISIGSSASFRSSKFGKLTNGCDLLNCRSMMTLYSHQNHDLLSCIVSQRTRRN